MYLLEYFETVVCYLHIILVFVKLEIMVLVNE